jgi:hypothetical protein
MNEISCATFGMLPDEREVQRYTLTGVNDMTAALMEFSAMIRSILCLIKKDT